MKSLFRDHSAINEIERVVVGHLIWMEALSRRFLSLLSMRHHGPFRPFKLNSYSLPPVSEGAVVP